MRTKGKVLVCEMKEYRRFIPLLIILGLIGVLQKEKKLPINNNLNEYKKNLTSRKTFNKAHRSEW
jgi:hypothetical protein